MNLVKEVFRYLNGNCNYAVLRNFSGLPEKVNSRDIDILISKADYNQHKNKIINIINNSGFKITTYFKNDRIITFVCGKIDSETIDLIQFDFFFQTSAYGQLILASEIVLENKLFNGQIYHVSREYEFLDKALYLKFVGHPYPEKYLYLKEELLQSQSLKQILVGMFGVHSIEELEAISASKLKRSLLVKNLKKRPLQQIHLFILFWFYYIKNKMTYKGFSVGFTGPDGAGKTTVINAIIKELSQVYSDIPLYHFRPTIIPNLGEAAHKTKLKSEVDLDYSNPHRGSQTSKINSFIRLLYYSIDYIIGYFLKTRPYLIRRNVVIFDRYFTDIIADSRRSRIFLNPKVLYWFGKIFIPKLDYNILLTAHKDIILGRKQELTPEGIDNINDKLNYLSDKKGYYLVFNEGEPCEAVQKILTIIFERQHKKNMKRL
ncbi:hypothetical protein N9936_00495 [bacterium]|nr:hypothetical protein [bacterium]